MLPTYNALINYLIEKEYATFDDGELKAEENTPRFSLRIRSTEIPEAHRTTIAGNIDRINDNPSTGVIPEVIKIDDHEFKLLHQGIIDPDSEYPTSQVVYYNLQKKCTVYINSRNEFRYVRNDKGFGPTTNATQFKIGLTGELNLDELRSDE